MKQFLLTPSAGKRLIAKTLARHPAITKALRNGTIVIVAGTTNGYVAEEIFKTHNVTQNFSRNHFFRGITLPPNQEVTDQGRLADESQFPGDVVITRGVWQKGKTIADIVDFLQAGDVIIKGANALDLSHKQAAVLVGHPKGGTIGLALPAVIGRRVKLIVPVGLEKRVNTDLSILAQKLNHSSAGGYRLMPLVGGEIFTEIEALQVLTGAEVELIAAGGVCGAEGSCMLSLTGNKDQEDFAERVILSISCEPAFDLSML